MVSSLESSRKGHLRDKFRGLAWGELRCPLFPWLQVGILTSLGDAARLWGQRENGKARVCLPEGFEFDQICVLEQ